MFEALIILRSYTKFKKHLSNMSESHDDKPFQLQQGTSLINGKYKVLSKVGAGSRSSVHAVSMFKGQKQVIRAIKVEASNVKEPQIKTQIAVLKAIKDSNPDQQGFTNIFQYGHQATFSYIIMSMLGPNLDQLQRLCGGSFSLKTTMIIALQILDRLQVLHNHGYIYGDISPDNFLVGLDNDSPFIFMVDFGRCKRYKRRSNGQHIYYKQNVHAPYNPTFASINAHNNIETSRRDDIKSLLYMIVYLKLGKLPWTRNSDKRKLDINIEELKKRLTPEMLCRKMPLQMIDLMYYVKSIEFYQRPDYDFIRKMFYRCLQREPFNNNIIYDWNNLQEIDFKVYSGEPRIVLKGTNPNDIKQEEPVSNSVLKNLQKEDDIDEQDEQSNLYMKN